MVIQHVKAITALGKLGFRLEKIIGEKRLTKILSKRKGLGKTRAFKMANYALKKPKSTLRRVKRVNTALNVAPYVATAGAAFGTGAAISSYNKKKSRGKKK